MTKVSEISSDSVGDVSSHEYIKKYAKQMLRNTLFVGTFQEKRFVESLDAYRDVITIAPEEEDFIKNIVVVKKKIDKDWLNKKLWFGITVPNTIGAPVGYNLWVELNEEVFGKYWYKVKTVEFLRNEIRLKLEVIRPFKREHTPLNSSYGELSATEQQLIDNFDFMVYLNHIPLRLRQNLIYFYTFILTFQNIKESVIFISLLIVAAITGAVHITQYLLEYLLKLIREFSGLLKVISPIIVTCINVIGRTIFGFYSMIVALSRDKPKPPPVYNSYINYDPRMLQDPRLRYNQYFSGELQYYPTEQRTGPIITPMD